MISLTLRPLLCLLLCLVGLSAAEPTRAGGSANLVVWNRHLMEFRAPIGFASVQERADRAAERIAQLPDEALALPIRPSRPSLANSRA